MRTWKKTFGLVSACGALILALAAGAGAPHTAAESGFQVVSDAQIAEQLGALQGDGSGVTEAYLAKPTQRIQSAIIQLRLEGLEADALAFKGSDNFADADLAGAVNRPVLAYLKAHPELGWDGVGSSKFDPLAVVTPQQYEKVLLETLGYQTAIDYAYSDTLAFAKTHGLARIAGAQTLHNRDIATALIEALQAKPKGADESLGQVLAKKGVLKSGLPESLSYERADTLWDSALGQILVDSKGKTLYYFTKDVADPNSCQGKCLEAWPIYDAANLRVPAGLNSADFGRFQRSDGKMQVTYKGWPLYYYAADKAPGDTKGENVGKVWFSIKVPEYSVMLGTSKEWGNYLTDAQGRTLYDFEKDTVGVSNCGAACLKAWPVFYTDSVVVPTGVDPGDFGVITRSDGSLQTTYKQYPLYYYTPDTTRGDIKGQDVGKVWYVVNPTTFTGTTAQKALDGK